MNLVNPICNYVQSVILTVAADWQVEGRENVPPMGPLIVVANHQSNFDPSLLSTSIPRRTWFLAKDGIFRGPLRSWFLHHYGAFPLNRQGADVAAYRWTLGRLERSQAVVVLPEGTRNRGSMAKAHPGVARLALKSGAPLLPIGITGTERLETWARIFYPTGRIRVNIGRVFTLPDIEGTPGRQVMDSLTNLIMERIAALLPPAYQGVYRLTGRGASEVPAQPVSGVEIKSGPLT